MNIQRQIEQILLEHIHAQYAENSGEARNHISNVANGISDDQSQAFISIHEHALKIIDQGAIRTRQVYFTSTGKPVGLAYYDRPIVSKRSSKEVMACLFPTRGFDNHLEFYFSGVGDDPSRLAEPFGPLRFGVPVLRAIEPANPHTVQWATGMLEIGFARSQTFRH